MEGYSICTFQIQKISVLGGSSTGNIRAVTLMAGGWPIRTAVSLMAGSSLSHMQTIPFQVSLLLVLTLC